MTFDDSSAMRHHDDADHHHHGGGRGGGGGGIEIGADDSNRFPGSSSDRNHYDRKRQKLIHHLNIDNNSGSASTLASASAAAPAPSASAPACLSSSNRTVSSANNSTAEGDDGCDDDNASASTEAHDDDEEEECSGGSHGEEGRKVDKDQEHVMDKESAKASVVQPDEEGKPGNDDVKRDVGSEGGGGGGGKDDTRGGDDDDDDVSQEERDTEFVDSFMRHSASVKGAVGAPGLEYSRAASAASASPSLLEETSVETSVTGGGVPTTVASSQQKGEGGGEVTASSAASTSATATSSSAATTTDDGEDGDGLTSMFPYRRKHSSSLSLQEFSWAPPQPQQNFVFTVQPTRPSPTSQQQVDSPNVSLSAASGAAVDTLMGTASTAADSKPTGGANCSTNAPSNDGTGSNNATWRDETEMFLDSPSPAALWTTGAMREANDYEATCDDFAFLDDLGFASSSTGDGYAMGEGDPSQPQHSFFYSSSGSTNNHLPLMLPEEQPTASSAVAVAAAVAAAAGSSSSNLQAGSRNASKIGTVLSAEATEKILDGLNPGPSKSDATTRQKRRRSSKSASPKSPKRTKAAATNASGKSISVPDLNGGKSGAKPKKSSKTTGSATPRTSNRSLPAHVVDYLKAWLHDPQHVTHPFPTDLEKQQMLIDTGLDLKRLNNWFVNYRYRHWKPQMEAEGKLIVNKHGGGNSSGPTKISENGGNGKGGNVRRTSATSVDSSVATAPSISSAPTALTMKVTPQFATSSNPVKLPPNGPPPPPSLQPGATGFATSSGALGLAAAAAAAMTNPPSKGTSSTTTISAKTKAPEVDIGLPPISSKTTSFGVPNPIFGANAQTSSTGDSST